MKTAYGRYEIIRNNKRGYEAGGIRLYTVEFEGKKWFCEVEFTYDNDKEFGIQHPFYVPAKELGFERLIYSDGKKYS